MRLLAAHGCGDTPTTPPECLPVCVVVEVNAICTLDSTTSVFDASPTPTRDSHTRSERILRRIRGDGTLRGFELQREKSAGYGKRLMEQALSAKEWWPCSLRHGSAGSSSLVRQARKFGFRPVPSDGHDGRAEHRSGQRTDLDVPRKCHGQQPLRLWESRCRRAVRVSLRQCFSQSEFPTC